MFNFRLQVFHAVATHLNFTKAAKELHITQPAVTNNIKELENSLGIGLFDREQNGISLTEAGRILLDYATRAMIDFQKLEYDLGIYKNSLSGRLKIGASTTIEQYVMPTFIAQFMEKHPDIKISMSNNNTKNVEADVISHNIDLGIIEGNIGQKEFKYIPFMKDEIVAIAHSSQEISKKQEITLDELVNTPLVLREVGSGTLDIILSELQKHKIKEKDLNVKMYLGSSESIKSFLANTNCLSFVSIHAISKEIVRQEFQIIDIEGFEIKRSFNFIYPQGQQNGLRDTFIDFCMQQK